MMSEKVRIKKVNRTLNRFSKAKTFHSDLQDSARKLAPGFYMLPKALFAKPLLKRVVPPTIF